MKKLAQIISGHLQGNPTETSKVIFSKISSSLQSKGFKPPFKISQFNVGDYIVPNKEDEEDRDDDFSSDTKNQIRENVLNQATKLETSRGFEHLPLEPSQAYVFIGPNVIAEVDTAFLPDVISSSDEHTIILHNSLFSNVSRNFIVEESSEMKDSLPEGFSFVKVINK